MITSRHPQPWVVWLILAFLILMPLLVVVLGTQSVTPFRVARVLRSNVSSEPMIASGGTEPAGAALPLRQPSAVSSTDVARSSPALSLDPQDNLHGFVLLPALAGLVILGGSLLVWAVLTRWQASARLDAQTAGRPRDRLARLRYGLLGFLWWLALSLFLILDLVGSVSHYPGFTTIYALWWVLVGLVLLHPRPLREKLLVVILLTTVLLSIRSVHWNSRKPFLKDLDRVSLGIPVAQVDELMGDYMKGTGPATQVDEQGGIVTGTITYRHTTEGWGNSDHGVLTIAGGRIVDVEFLPD